MVSRLQGACGFAPGTEHPWQSVDNFQTILGQFQQLGFTEISFLEPTPEQWPVFEKAITAL